VTKLTSRRLRSSAVNLQDYRPFAIRGKRPLIWKAGRSGYSGPGVPCKDFGRHPEFDPLDAAPLRIATDLEPFALAVAQMAYEGESSPELADRFERFENNG
jgi:hypothetical protein